MRKILYILLLLPAWCFAQQAQPVNPVQVPQATLYNEPSTGTRWWYNGATLGWYPVFPYSPPNTVLTGLGMSVVSSTLTVATGTWRINSQVYSLSSPANFTLQARDTIYSRYETVYATKANNGIGIKVGGLSPTPIQPTVGTDSLVVAAVLITPTQTIIIPPGPSNQFVFAIPSVQQSYANPWVRTLKTDTLKVAGKYIFPSVDGTSAQVLQTDGSGHLYWSSQAIYTPGFGMHLNAQAFSVDTTKIVTTVALLDTLRKNAAHLNPKQFIIGNDTLNLNPRDTTAVDSVLGMKNGRLYKGKSNGGISTVHTSNGLSGNGSVGSPVVLGGAINTVTNVFIDSLSHSLFIGDQKNQNGIVIQNATENVSVSIGGGNSSNSKTDYISGNENGIVDLFGSNGSVSREFKIDPTPSTGGIIVYDSENKGLTGNALFTVSGDPNQYVQAGNLTALDSNIYKTDGVLTSNRTVTLNDKTLTFSDSDPNGNAEYTIDIDGNTSGSTNGHTTFNILPWGTFALTTSPTTSNRVYLQSEMNISTLLTDVYMKYVENSTSHIKQFGIFEGANGIPVKNEVDGYSLIADASIDTAKMTSTPKSYVTAEWVTHHVSAGATGANPTATAGTSAVNGSATTFMRSDAAPKVDSTVFQTVSNFFPKGDTRYVKTSALLNHVAGYGLSGSNYNTSVSQTWTADTSSSTGLVSKGRLATNLGGYVKSVSVASANGLSGTSSGGQTPSLTLTLSTIKPNVVAQTPAGTAGTDSVMVKHSDGTMKAISPTYYGASGGGVTTFSAGTTGFTPNSATSGTVTLAGTLVVANGGTGVTSVTTAPTASAWVGQDANKNYSVNNVLNGWTTITSASGTTTLTVSSTKYQQVIGTQGQTIQLPATSTLVLGQEFVIINNSASNSTVTIVSSGGNTIVSLSVNQSAKLICVSTSGTGASSWTALWNVGSYSSGDIKISGNITASIGTFSTIGASIFRGINSQSAQLQGALTSGGATVSSSTVSLWAGNLSAYTNSSLVAQPFGIIQTYNQTSTAGSTDFSINRTETALGSGAHKFASWQVSGTEKWAVDNKGNTSMAHLVGNTSAPTIAAGTGAGTSPTVTVTGSDLGHQVNVTTGTSPTVSATVATVTFNVAYASAPKVIQLTPANSVTAALNGTAQIYVDSSSTTTTVYVIKVGSGGLAASTAYSWFCTVIQ